MQPTELGIRRARARRGFGNFRRYMRPNQTPPWFHDLLDEYLTKLQRGEIKRLIVTMPPGHAKSDACSRLFPAYVLGLDPSEQIAFGSYGADLASSMNRATQANMTTQTYRDLFPETQLSERGIRTADTARRTSDGFDLVGHSDSYNCAGVGGPLTGKRGTMLILDDPYKNFAEANSAQIRENVWTWFSTVFMTRGTGDRTRALIVTTRWHKDDIVGRIEEQEKTARANGEEFEPWVRLDLAALMTKELMEKKHPRDPRQPGDPLWPEVHSLRTLQEHKRNQGLQKFEAVYQQNPKASEGNVFKRAWFKRFRRQDLPPRFDRIGMYVDATNKKSANSDFVAIGVWGKKDNNFYLLDVVHRRMSFLETAAAIRSMKYRWPQVDVIKVEYAANGYAIVDALTNGVNPIAGVVGIPAKEKKEVRADAVTGYFDAGNVLVPTDDEADWVFNYVEEMVAFPGGSHDDQVDMTSMALPDLNGGTTGAFTQSMSASQGSIEQRWK